GALGGERHRQHADLGLGSGVDAGAEARGQELHAEAGAEVRHAGADGLADRRLLGRQPGQLGVVVHAHGAAHRDDRVEPGERRERLALVELDPVQRGPALVQDGLVFAGRLAGDVLEDDDVHAQASWLPRAMARRSRAVSRISSSTPWSRATSRSDRPDAAASFTIAVARSYPM